MSHRTDEILQELAECITEQGLNYYGGVFDYTETGEEFTITVARRSHVLELEAKVKELEALLASAVADE